MFLCPHFQKQSLQVGHQLTLGLPDLGRSVYMYVKQWFTSNTDYRSYHLIEINRQQQTEINSMPLKRSLIIGTDERYYLKPLVRLGYNIVCKWYFFRYSKLLFFNIRNTSCCAIYYNI